MQMIYKRRPILIIIIIMELRNQVDNTLEKALHDFVVVKMVNYINLLNC